MGNLSTTIQVGKARAEISLVKMSASPKEAKHETRRVVVDPLPGVEPIVESPAPVAAPPATDPFDPFEDAGPQPVRSGPDTHTLTDDMVRTTTLVEERIEHGVHRDTDGEWVDLTSLLADIDEGTKIEGMLLEATVNVSAIPREYVRDAFYVVPKNPSAHKFCTLVWHGLRESSNAAVVRWTKRTGQYLGLVVARGRQHLGTMPPHLLVVQLEWTQNIKDVPPSARLDMTLMPGGNAPDNAIKAMRSLSQGARFLDTLRDERAAQRAELLAAARGGRKYKRPAAPENADIEWLGTMLAEAQQ